MEMGGDGAARWVMEFRYVKKWRKSRSVRSVTCATLIMVLGLMGSPSCVALARSDFQIHPTAIAMMTMVAMASQQLVEGGLNAQLPIAAGLGGGVGQGALKFLSYFQNKAGLPDCSCFVEAPVCSNETGVALQQAIDDLVNLKCNTSNNCFKGMGCRRAFYTVNSHMDGCPENSRPALLTPIMNKYIQYCKECFFTPPWDPSLPACQDADCSSRWSMAPLHSPLCLAQCSQANSTCDIAYKKAVAFYGLCKNTSGDLFGTAAVQDAWLKTLDSRCQSCNIVPNCSSDVNLAIVASAEATEGQAARASGAAMPAFIAHWLLRSIVAVIGISFIL